MKEVGRRWLTKAMVIVLLLIVFVQLVMEQASAWAVVRSAMLLGVLWGGSVWGIPGGALAGALAGIAELMAGQGMEAIGLLCVMGILAGFFHTLGRWGTVVAFVCSAVGLGLWYAETYFFMLLPDLVAAVALYMMFPVKTMFPHRPREKLAGKRDELQRQKLEQVAESYGKLARSMEGQDLSVCQEDWEICEDPRQNHVMERREAVSMQFREMERALREMAAQLDQAVDVTDMVERQVRTGLWRRRLHLQQLLVLEGQGQRQEAYVTVCSQGTGCVTAREVGESVGKILSRSMRPAEGERTVVGKESCTIRLVEENQYRLLSGLARAAKAQEDLSGDTFSCHELPDGQMMLCLSDGMGSGRQAFLESQMVTEWLEELLEAGFVPERAIHMVNSLLLVQKEQAPTTMDLALIDLYDGEAFFYKQGAVGTFIRRKDQVLQVEPGALPMGVACEAVPRCARLQLQDGDMIVMVTDGVLDALEGEDKEETLCQYLAASTTKNATELAQNILDWATGAQALARDDMTVLTAGIWRKQ